jgi:hypothetical protein
MDQESDHDLKATPAGAGAIPPSGRPGRVWCIGVYRGPTPLAVAAPGLGYDPVLAAKDIDDIDAAFVADPFLIWEREREWMFFEIKNRLTRRGEVGLASFEGGSWTYRGSVLREPFHLSYPYVFEWGGTYFMTPEALEPNTVRLYRSDQFPGRWTHQADLIAGEFADPSLLRFDDRWWMFVCSEPFRNDLLRLFHADHLEGPWYEHPRSPIVVDDPRRARPAGRIIIWDDRVIRFAQDCVPTYGMSVRAFEITELSRRCYREVECPSNPILTGSGAGWNRGGMHHIDSHRTDNGDWIASVDGWTYATPDADE